MEIITNDSLFIGNSINFIPYTGDGYVSGELIMIDGKIFFFDFEKFSRNLADLKILNISALHENILE